MRKMCSQIDNIVSVYKTLSKIPALLDGKLNSAGNRITSSWVIRNVDKGKATKYEDTYVLDENLKVLSKSDFGSDVSNILLSQVSPQERYKAVIREEKESKEKKKQLLEIWSKSSLKHSIDLTALDLHGDVYCDSMFGGLNWSADESSVVYVAERKVKKSEPYIKRKSEGNKDGGGEDAPVKGEEHTYRQDWGEQFVGKFLSVVVVCRIETETFTVLEGLPESWCPGQVRFTPDGKGVVGVAFETEPRRLGLVFCTNRPSYIFQLSLDGTGGCCKISPEGAAVQSPQFSPDGTLVWLQRPAGGPHHACHAVMAKKQECSEIFPVVDIVKTERQLSDGTSFYGMYSHHLPHCACACAVSASADGARLVFSTPQRTEIRTYVVDIEENGRMLDISNNKTISQSTAVLDVKNDVILAVCSSMTAAPRLYVAKLPPKRLEDDIVWVPVSEPFELPPSLANATVEYLDLTHDDSTDTVKSFNALYVAPACSGERRLPLIVFPHGGPHSGFVTGYSAIIAQFTMLGMSTVCVNYRGSTGAGDASARCLLSRAGEYDVSDCHLALTTLLERDAHSDVFLYGGSFGGFTVGHLAAKYPDLFTAMVMRNPLIDMATKGQCADNSEGCAVEAGFEFTEKGPVSDEELLAMRRCSPLAHVHKVKAPTALLIGTGDRRVPPHQGLEFYRRLKANGVKTKLYWYDDNHNLASLPVEMDQTINTSRWFLEHISPDAPAASAHTATAAAAATCSECP